jgi:hypothetical protein
MGTEATVRQAVGDRAELPPAEEQAVV